MIPMLEAFAPAPPAPAPGIHTSATIDPGARIDPAASIGPLCVVGERAIIGPRAVLMNSVSIGAGVSIGEGTNLHPGVVVESRCSIGKSCIIHGCAVIGADGFGYRPTGRGRSVTKVPHVGDVRVGDHVEIGAGTCIDRAKFGSTTIGSGTKIDNLVQIAHNCRIGRDCIICGLCGLSGSVTLGDGVILAGQVGIADGITIGTGARVGARSGVNEDIPAGESWLGAPAMPMRDAARNYAVMRDIATHIRELRKFLRADAGKLEP
jgi:UDP-3-O-[3-hydroxymyristoyl] glucosamine N-acyltransferase